MSGAFQGDAFQADAFQVDTGGVRPEARWGVMRWGAFRWGAFTPRQCVSIAGTDWSSLIQEGSIRIHQAMNDEPDTAEFIVNENDVFTPTPGQEVIIGSGSLSHREFGGQILRVTEILTGGVARPLYQVSCQDWGKRLDRRTVTQVWLNVSASEIAAGLLQYTDGFTGNAITPNLPTIEYFEATNQKPSELFRKLATLVGGAYFVDEYRDVHLWGTAGEYHPRTNPLPITDAAPDTLRAFVRERDSSQWRTRVIVEGQGTKVIAPISIYVNREIDPELAPIEIDVLVAQLSASFIPVETAEMFNSLGGRARVAQELITYTGRVLGGPGSLVGPGVSPPTYLVPTPQAGAGVDSGFHLYAFTWVTAAGETLPSPLHGVITGLIAAPTTTPARVASSGSELGIGTYQYAVTFVVGAGETIAGPTGSVATSAGIAAPSSSPAATASWFPGEPHTGGRYVAGDSVWCRCSFVDASGNETGGTDSNTVTVGSGPASVLFYNLPSSSDPAVVLKRLYLNVNGSFVAYKDLPVGQFSDSWFNAGTGTGSFPVGGNPARRRVTLSSIPTGPSGTTARRIYRTTVGGSQLKLVVTIGDNTTTGYVDAIADGSLGANAPTSSTATLNQVGLAEIEVGPSGVTSRKVYRTAAGGTQLKLVTTLADNTTRTYTDATADSALGADAPTGDTSGLTQETGQVNAGSTSLLVAGPGAFSPIGGWARVGEQVIRYSNVVGSSLTGIPSSGVGSLQATVNYGTTITEAPRLTGITGLTHDILRGASIHLRVQEDDLTAQAIIATIEGDGGGIYEHTIVDQKLSEDGARARALAELAAFGRTLPEMEWETEDMNARPGRTQTVALVQSGSPAVAEIAETALLIQSADVTWPAPDTLPRRRCRAGTVKRADVIDVAETQRD